MTQRDTKIAMARIQGLKTAVRIQKGEASVILLDEINRLIDLIEHIPQGDTGERGKAADENLIITEVLKRIRTPKDGQSVDFKAVVKEVLRQIPRPQDGQTPVLDYPYIIKQVLRQIPFPQDGRPGEPGKTPVKGKDYFTQEDVNEIVAEVIKKVPKIVEKNNLPSISLITRGGGGGGQVKDIVAGTNVTIVKTDGGKYIISSSGSGGGIAGTFNYEAPSSGAINGTNNIYTFSHTIGEVIVNGQIQIPGGVDVTVTGSSATLVTPPEINSTVYNKYLT